MTVTVKSLPPMQRKQNRVGLGVSELHRETQCPLNVNMYEALIKILDVFEIPPGNIFLKCLKKRAIPGKRGRLVTTYGEPI